jgi:tRNA pseudouridine32 synthase/23S rRNA pseudouridine746 synthase
VARDIQDTFIAPPCAEAIKVLHHDEAIIVIDKPSGLLSLSGKNPLNADSVHSRLIKKWPEALMVHRLDFGTSGLLVLVRTKAAATELNKQFQAKTILKSYEAVLHGLVETDMGVIDAPIARDDENFPKMKIGDEGKSAQTHFRVLDRDEIDFSTRVELAPKTGRTHQLRIHCAHIGHPMLGCDIYGTAESLVKAERLSLHAKSLSFAHPKTSERMVFKSDCPF